MDNQQQNETIKIIWEGKTIKKEHLIELLKDLEEISESI